jgi:hypothetical protein
MDYAADDVAAIAQRAKELAAEREAARAYWCSCGHEGRMDWRHEDGHAVCSACAKPVME